MIVYAVIESGGKQHKIEAGDEVLLEKVSGKPGDKVKLNKVVFLKSAKGPVVDPKHLSKAKVKAVIVDQTKGQKMTVYKYKAKKNYRRTRGHRSHLTRVRIEELEFGQEKAVAEPKKEKKKAAKSKKEVAKKEPAKTQKVATKKEEKGTKKAASKTKKNSTKKSEAKTTHKKEGKKKPSKK